MNFCGWPQFSSISVPPDGVGSLVTTAGDVDFGASLVVGSGVDFCGCGGGVDVDVLDWGGAGDCWGLCWVCSWGAGLVWLWLLLLLLLPLAAWED